MTAPGREIQAALPLSSSGSATVTGLYGGAELAAGDLIAGRFRIEELLGIGGMGVVYRAIDEQLEVSVALKLLRPELASRADAFARFRHEILLARQVSSPHVVRLHDIFQHEGRWLLSMDYVPGDSLDRYIDKHGPLSVSDALKITRQLALGLAAAHQRDVVHRDLKPANVLLTAGLDAYISDFGVALSAGVTRMTGSGVIVGTPEYLSPEQARAERVDARSDLYTLGLILYEMLTGKLPFPSGTPAEMLAHRIVRTPPPVARARPDVPAWVNSLTTRLLQLKPARRLQRAEDVVSAIDKQYVAGALPPARTWASAAVALLLAGSAAAWLWQRAGEVPAPTTEAVAPTVQTRALELAVLPLIATTEESAIAAAVGDLLSESLLAAGLSSASTTRTQRGLRQLGFDNEAAQRHVGRVLETLAAGSALSGELTRSGERWKLSLRLRDAQQPDAPGVLVSSGEVTLDALALATRQLLVELELLNSENATRDGLAWPHSEAGLRSYGAGLLAQQASELAAARADFQRATELEPGFALAWSRRIDALEQARETTAAAAAAQAALLALRGARGRDVDAVRAMATLIEGDAAAAVERLKPLSLAAPADHALALLYARALDESGDIAAAQAQRERVVGADPQNPLAWFALGKAAILAGAAQRGVDDYLVRAQVLYNRLGDARGQAEVSNALGIGYERLGQLDAALEQFAKVAELREKLGEPQAAANSLLNLAGLRMVRGEFDTAAADLARARTLLAPLKDPHALADLANSEGLLFEERGDFRAALQAYREALTLRQPLGDSALTAESQINVGFAYFHSGEFDNAAIFWNQAEAGFAAADDAPGAVRARQSLGLLAQARGDWPRARQLLEATLASAEELQMIEEQAVSLGDLADLDRLEGRIGDALRGVDRARSLFAQRQDQRGTNEMYLTRAAILVGIRAWDAADAALAPLLQAVPGNQEQAALLALRLGEIALGRGQSAAALRHAETAQTTATAAHSQPALIAALALQAAALHARQETGRAAQILAQAQDAWQRHPSRPLALTLVDARLRIEASPKAYGEAAQLLTGHSAYIGAFAMHQTGAAILRQRGAGPAATLAEQKFLETLQALVAATPAEFQAGLLALRPAASETAP